MAKWGEGDPRWIVEERPDATNVNNWHWTEKNATHWSKKRINELFEQLEIKQDGILCLVEGVDKCTGEATANNRKGKLRFFYEWEVVLKWSGYLDGNTKNAHKGKVTIPNLSEENELHEVEITITIDESNNESETLKQFMYNVGREKIRTQIGLYIKELKEEYSKNLILPKKGDETCGGTNQNTTNGLSAAFKTTALRPNADNSANNVKSSSTTSVGCKLDVKTLNMTEEFHCRANDLFNALTKTDMLTAFTRASVKIDAVRGGEFILYGGNVHGKFEELVPEKKIVQTWRLKNWPSGHFSNVTIELKESTNCTKMTLKQTGIPASEFDSMRTNWHRYYWHSIKQSFGFGSSLMDAL